MTSEAIVMNRSAVALAADSAVTIGRPGRSKTFETVNKLFELIKGSNVGVMIYSSASINNMPWETVIKTYRREYSSFSAAHVEDYADHFTTFIASHRGLLREDDEYFAVLQHGVTQIQRNLMNPLFNWPEDNLLRANGGVVKTRVKRAIDELCDRWQVRLDRISDIPLNGDTSAEIKTKFTPILCKLVDKLFAEYVIDPTAAQTKRLAQLTLVGLTKDVLKGEGTGLVFAGFGGEDYFPKMYSTRIRARLCGEILATEGTQMAITAQEPAFLETFAQDGPAKGWINGIHEEVRDSVVQEWQRWVSRSLRRQATAELIQQGVDEADARELSKAFQSVARKQLDVFERALDKLGKRQFEPMQQSIAVLPKDELGLLAESLVNLTSLRQRMSIDQQNTVGGAIDVAVISIGDGFVWLNRKHYFESALNPAWHLTHGASIRAAVTNATGGPNAN